MDKASEQRLILIVLRIAGILTVLIGLILTTQTIIQLMAVNSVTSNIPRGMNVDIKMRSWAIIAQLSVAAWGVVVYKLSGWLSEIVTGQTGNKSEPN